MRYSDVQWFSVKWLCHSLRMIPGVCGREGPRGPPVLVSQVCHIQWSWPGHQMWSRALHSADQSWCCPPGQHSLPFSLWGASFDVEVWYNWRWAFHHDNRVRWSNLTRDRLYSFDLRIYCTLCVIPKLQWLYYDVLDPTWVVYILDVACVTSQSLDIYDLAQTLQTDQWQWISSTTPSLGCGQFQGLTRSKVKSRMSLKT